MHLEYPSQDLPGLNRQVSDSLAGFEIDYDAQRARLESIVAKK
jgi:hypothetical protein